MREEKLVSVLMPVYNGASYLENAICSIQAQTYLNWELLILDDGSQDTSLAICQALAENDQRLHVFSHYRNLGLAATMNHLVQMANGDYLAIQEQDDVSLSHRLLSEVALLNLMPEVGLVSGIA